MIYNTIKQGINIINTNRIIEILNVIFLVFLTLNDYFYNYSNILVAMKKDITVVIVICILNVQIDVNIHVGPVPNLIVNILENTYSNDDVHTIVHDVQYFCTALNIYLAYIWIKDVKNTITHIHIKNVVKIYIRIHSEWCSLIVLNFDSHLVFHEIIIQWSENVTNVMKVIELMNFLFKGKNKNVVQKIKGNKKILNVFSTSIEPTFLNKIGNVNNILTLKVNKNFRTKISSFSTYYF